MLSRILPRMPWYGFLFPFLHKVAFRVVFCSPTCVLAQAAVAEITQWQEKSKTWQIGAAVLRWSMLAAAWAGEGHLENHKAESQPWTYLCLFSISEARSEDRAAPFLHSHFSNVNCILPGFYPPKAFSPFTCTTKAKRTHGWQNGGE